MFRTRLRREGSWLPARLWLCTLATRDQLGERLAPAWTPIVSDLQRSEDSRRGRLLDVLGFQLSLQSWVAVCSSVIVGVFALLVWIFR